MANNFPAANASPEPPKPTRSRNPGFWKLALNSGATALFALTSWFAASTFSEKPGYQANYILQSHFELSFSSTIVILRVLQSVTSALTTLAVDQAWERAAWITATRAHGVRLLCFLGLSPSTGMWGVTQLLFGKTPNHIDRLPAVSRILSTGVLFAAGIMLWIGTSTITAHYATRTFNVTAGTGQFNGSLIAPFLRTVENQVPFWVLASTYSFVTNSQFATPTQALACPDRGAQCDSFFFPGGTYLMYPQPEARPAANVTIVIRDAPGTQIEFVQGLDSGDRFKTEDCTSYGAEDSLVGVYLCLAASKVMEGSTIAGIFRCPNGAQGGDCNASADPVLNVTTTMTVYNRRATSVCSARNNSILSVSDLGEPHLDRNIDRIALKRALGWLLDYPAAGMPAMSSTAFFFWFAPSANFNSVWESNAYTSLQSLLAFIIWEFCPNNNGNPAIDAEQTDDLPADFHTKASFSEPYTRFVLNRAAFIAYLVLETVALVFCWATVFWQAFSGGIFDTLSFRQVDFHVKLRDRGAGLGAGSSALRLPLGFEANDTATRHALANTEVIVPVRENGNDVNEA